MRGVFGSLAKVETQRYGLSHFQLGLKWCCFPCSAIPEPSFLCDGDQIDFEMEGFERWNHITRAFVAVAEFGRNDELVF